MKKEYKEKVLKKFSDLKNEGYQINRSCGWDGRDYYRHPSDLDYKRYRTESLNIVRQVCGETSDYYQELKKLGDNSYYLKDCIGIVEAASKDFEEGYLINVRSLILSELLGDFIDQSNSLFEQGYIVAAASLSGAVLEDSLRKLCEKNNIDLPLKTKIDKLNADLARKEVYSVGIQKRITAIADIRNLADHGKFSDVKKDDVEDMIKWISKFTSDFLN